MKIQPMTLAEAISAWMHGRPVFGELRQQALDALQITAARSRSTH
jgi:hypothetical protein